MHVIADLHLHSRFSRAVSKQMTLPVIALWAEKKGIGLVATGDWTHPMWMREIERDLEEMGNGFLKLKSEARNTKSEIHTSVSTDGFSGQTNPKSKIQILNSNCDPMFLLATEISCIFTQGGKGRRVHTLVWVPTITAAQKINREMTKRGLNLLSDARPIIGLSSIELADLVLNIEPRALVIPAHAWTPWFSLYGSKSGFDSIEESFGPFADRIYAVETGLSSSPAMNWQIPELDRRTIVSFSDAHSMAKLGREATVFATDEPVFTYDLLYEAIASRFIGKKNPRAHIAYTIEFYPEEGKYHLSGHRSCNVRLGPEDTKKHGGTCPVCGKPLTQGVVQRVGELAGRTEKELDLEVRNVRLFSDSDTEVAMTSSRAYADRPPYVMAVPLAEILAESLERGVNTQSVQTAYDRLIHTFGSEFTVLLKTTLEDIRHEAGDRVAEGIKKVRTGDIAIDPGYDGVFGVVRIWKDGETKPLVDSTKEQLGMF